MAKYVCSICGYVYDDEVEKVPFDKLPDDWKCPLCGAEKSLFVKQEDNEPKEEKNVSAQKSEDNDEKPMREINNGELSAICSNLSRGCEKQYMSEEAKLYDELSKYYALKVQTSQSDMKDISEKIDKELKEEFVTAKNMAEKNNDRGAKRVLTWSEKVTRMTQSLLSRYHNEGSKMLENQKIWVCDICGFIYIGDNPPAVCPICKVPSLKILEVK